MFIAAGVTDALDGFIAKHFNVRTTLGGYLDPLADKALLMIGLCHARLSQDHIEDWLVILIVFRDVLIIGGAILYQTLTQSLTMQPLWISKINTVAQIMLAALAARLARARHVPGPRRHCGLLTWIVAASTVRSGLALSGDLGLRASSASRTANDARSGNCDSGWSAWRCFLIALYLLRAVLLPFVAGIAIAYLLDPLCDRLERAGCSRLVAT